VVPQAATLVSLAGRYSYKAQRPADIQAAKCEGKIVKVQKAGTGGAGKKGVRTGVHRVAGVGGVQRDLYARRRRQKNAMGKSAAR